MGGTHYDTPHGDQHPANHPRHVDTVHVDSGAPEPAPPPYAPEPTPAPEPVVEEHLDAPPLPEPEAEVPAEPVVDEELEG